MLGANCATPIEKSRPEKWAMKTSASNVPARAI
jgi:hypothetical protein